MLEINLPARVEEKMKNKIPIILWLLVSIFSAYSIAPGQSERGRVLAVSKKVVMALKQKDMKRLATFVHPARGVRFSPFAYINKSEDLVFKKIKSLIF